MYFMTIMLTLYAMFKIMLHFVLTQWHRDGMGCKWAGEPADTQTNYLGATYGTVFSVAGRASLDCLMTLKLEQLKVYKEARLEST